MKGKAAALLALLLPALAQAQGYAGMGAPAPGFETPKPGTPIVFPKDHGAHPGFRTEWWYLTANLHGADGAAYGVQWTLFRHALEPGAGANVFMAHAAATSATTHVFAETTARAGVGQAGVEAAPFSAFIDDWTFEAEDAAFTRARVAARAPRFSYALTLSRGGPFVLQGEAGFSQKSQEGQSSHYYSQGAWMAAMIRTVPAPCSMPEAGPVRWRWRMFRCALWPPGAAPAGMTIPPAGVWNSSPRANGWSCGRRWPIRNFATMHAIGKARST